jgi:hypothetical protein
MKRQYPEHIVELVEAVVGLFIILPNPQLKGKEKEITKIALELLDKRLNEDIQSIVDEVINDDDKLK